MMNQATTESGICSIILHTLLTIVSAILANAIFPLTKGFGYTLLAILLFFALFLFFRKFIPLVCETIDNWLSPARGSQHTPDDDALAENQSDSAIGAVKSASPAPMAMAVEQAVSDVEIKHSTAINESATQTAIEDSGTTVDTVAETDSAKDKSPDATDGQAEPLVTSDATTQSGPDQDQDQDNDDLHETAAAESSQAALVTEAEQAEPELINTSSPEPAPEPVTETDGEPDQFSDKSATGKSMPTTAVAENEPDSVAGPQAAGLLSRPRGDQADDLKKIKGVGPKLEKLCNELGIYHFDQIAAWTQEDVDYIDSRLSFKGRIKRDNWIEQARQLVEQTGS